MNKESWYASKHRDMDVIRISESDDWIVDYDRNRGMYRVSYFQDNHFVDEFWFDAYEEKEVKNCFFVECKLTDEELKELVEQSKQDLIKDGVDLEELKNYIG